MTVVVLFNPLVKDKWVYNFPKGISSKVNWIKRLEFELTYCSRVCLPQCYEDTPPLLLCVVVQENENNWTWTFYWGILQRLILKGTDMFLKKLWISIFFQERYRKNSIEEIFKIENWK